MRGFAYKAACSFFGLGYLPKFPGTWATLGAAGIYGGLLAAGTETPMLFWGPAAAAVAVSAISVPLGNRAPEAFGRKDPGQFVLDEIAGFCVSLVFLTCHTVGTGAVAFLAFRAFDIWKPWPIRRLEHIRGGWGILLDDLAAGILANLAVRLAVLLFDRL